MTRFFFVKAPTSGTFVPSKYQYVAPQPLCMGSGQPLNLGTYSTSFSLPDPKGSGTLGMSRIPVIIAGPPTQRWNTT